MIGRTLLPALALAAASLSASAQVAFTNASHLLSNTTTSGGCMGVVDMNGDGLDDICKLHNSRVFQVDYQNPDGTFTLVDYGQVSGSGQWGMTIADMSNTGHKDLISGGSYDGVHYMRISATGQATLADLNNGNMFTQCVNVADINNDGHNDYWACHDDAAPRQWLNDGNGGLSYANIFDYTTDPTSDMSGNYGSVWIDFDNDGDLDLYIAKCRQGVNNPNDPRRWNRLFVNDGQGNYTDMADVYGIQVRNQSWTADFGDIDNDGDLDLVLTNHDATIQLFENDGSGYFTEITQGSGLEVTGFFLQSKFVDLDNDGFLDLLIAGGSGAHYTFLNNGNKTFTNQPNTFPAPKSMHSFATGDLNDDGFVDVWANYGSSYINADSGNPDRLWLNNGNANHWLTVRLQGTTSNRDAIGARVTIQGPWGTQIREVRAGESYGMVTTFACMFGLGQETVVPTVTVLWPSGLEETFTNVSADQHITLIEGTCIAPVASIGTPDGVIICGNGDSVTLTANDGFNYTWSTGDNSQSIEVSLPGNYLVTIDDGQGCSAITGVIVVLAPDETPTVTLDGETTICEGQVVTLSSSEAQGYAWSNGASGQSTQVGVAGTYTVTIQGTCGAYTSDAVTIAVLDSPEAPVADDVTIPAPGSATLIAVGENIQWYDVATGGTALGDGNVWQTPSLSSTTSFWASATTQYGGEEAYGARTDRDADNGVFHTNSDNYQFFTANEPFILRSVKVYAGNAGNRTIRIIDRSDGSTVVDGVFNIPAGESRVQLDFVVPGPGNYGLRCVGGNPQLWRDGLNSVQTYPYPLGTLGAVTSSSVAGNNATAYYYFFYDWEVEQPGFLCESPRTEVVVQVGGVGIDEAGASVTRVWPVPAVNELNITLGEAITGQVTVELTDLTGRMVRNTSADARTSGGLLTLPVHGLAAGEYMLAVRHANGREVHHVMVH